MVSPMTSADGVSPSPSLAEFTGPYNVPRPLGIAFIEPSVELSELAPISFSEMNDVTDCLLKAAGQVGLGDSELYYDLGMADRTASCAPRNSELLTEGLIDAIQSHVLRKHPLWRVVIVASNEEDAFVIYSNVVKFNRPVVSLRNEIKRIRDLETAIEAKIDGDRVRQRFAIEKALANRPIPATPFRPWIVAVFGTWRGKPNYMTAWILESGHLLDGRSWLSKKTEAVANGYQGCDELFDVTGEGVVVPSYTAGDDFRGAITCHIFDKSEFDGIINLRNPDTGECFGCSVDSLRVFPKGTKIP